MSSSTYLASSKEIILPDEINDYYNRRIFDEPNISMSISPIADNDSDIDHLRKIITMPFIYHIGGLGSEHFWLYVEKYMEIGDVLEIIIIYQQSQTEKYVQRMLENPEPIHINVGKLTYTNRFGTYQLEAKNWVDDLKHRTLATYRGVTTIEKY